MRLSAENIKDIMDAIKALDVFRPMVSEIIDKIMDYGPELEKLTEAVRKAVVRNQIASIKEYEDAGFTRAEAILLTINGREALSEAIKSARTK